MKLYSYDIWDGNKGIIIAKDIDQATELFRKEYPDIPLWPNDTDEYDSGVARIDLEMVDLKPKPMIRVIME